MTTNTNTAKLQNKSNGKVGMYIQLIICLAVPLIVGLVSSRITIDQMETFGQMNQPPLSPPALLFPIAWTILYILMGLASFFILRSDSKYKVAAMAFYISQLVMNFIWSPIFFNSQEYVTAFVIIILMWTTNIILAITCWLVDKRATFCLIPLILWTTFAAYLNAGIAVLN